MNAKVLIGGAIFLGALVVNQITELPTAKITVKVLDEAGNPVPNATVAFHFTAAHAKWGEEGEAVVSATTDAAGMASGSGYSTPTLNCGVKKDGYYEGGPNLIQFADVQLGRWQPWNATYSVVLKKIIDPIPMYAKKVQIKIPVLSQPIGFDLTAGDWVQPYGKGTTSDFIFTISQTLNGPMDFNTKLSLAFTNSGDGLQVALSNWRPDQGGSQLKFPRNAPQDGYVGNWTTAVSRNSSGRKENGSNGMGYYFRVRTSKTVQGEIKSADYGKIDGDISIMGAATTHPGISFTYYFNPTGTTNLEFDPTKNLLKVAPLEGVWNP